MTFEPGTTTTPSFNEDEEIFFRDDQETFTDFASSPFTININSDNDDAPMTKGRFKHLSEKIDSILENSNTFSSTKWENLLTTHRETVEMLTLASVKVLEEYSKAIHASEKKIFEATENVKKLHQ